MTPEQLLETADRLASQGDLPGALASIDQHDALLAHLPESHRDRLRGRVARGETHLRLLQLDAAEEIGVALLGPAGSDPELLARVELLIANCAVRRRQLDRAEMFGHRARERFAARGDRAGLSQALHALGAAASYRGELGRARKLLVEAIALADALGDLGRAARCLNQLGYAEFEDGRQAEARATLERAIEAARAAGLPLVAAQAAEGLTFLALELGDLASARARLAEAAACYPPDVHRSALWSAEGEIARRGGDLDRAERLMRAAIAENAARGPAASLAYSLGLAQVLADRGALDEAHALAGEALDVALDRVRGRIGIAGAVSMAVAARRQRAPDWERAYRWTRAAWRDVGDTGSEMVDLAADSGRAWTADDADADALARAARSHQLALTYARKIIRADLVRRESAALEALADRAPIPVGGFDLYQTIGRGGFGLVWRAVRRADGAPAAVKVLTHDGARRPGRLAAFEAEIRTAVRLEHPCLAAVLDYGAADPAADLLSRGTIPDGSPFFAMELAAGTLHEHRRTLPWRTVRPVLLSILRGLAYAHARGVLHRDLKPANVLVVGSDPADGVRLADFGLAATLADDTPVQLHAGTPAYMAPEQLDGRWRDFGPWTDLFGVGRIAAALLTPGTPVPAGWSAWLGRALATDPADRWRHAADAAEALLTLPEGPEPVVAPPRRALGAPSPATFDLDDPQLSPQPSPDRSPRLPVPARRGPEVSASQEGPSRSALGRPPRLLGRDEEMSRLVGLLGEVSSTGSARVVVVRGAPGSGKTLLVRRFAEAMAEVGRARALHADGSGVVALVHQGLRATGLAGQELDDRLSACLGALGFDDGQVRGLVLALGHARTRPGGSDRAARSRAACRVLSALAAERPLIAVIDDVLAAPASVSFAEALLAAQATAPAPILLVLVVGDELPERLGQATVLSVGPLPPSARHQLLAELLGLDRLAEAEVEARAHGNPQLVQVLVQDWRERGILLEGPDGWTLRPGVIPDLPAGLGDAWRSRVGSFLERQRPDAARALELLAVLGPTADLQVWRRACALEGCVVGDDAIDRWVRAGVVDRSVDVARFEVTMFRDALLERARGSGRAAEHHAACAAALEAIGHPADRGRHLLGAGRTREGADLLLIAAREEEAPSRVLALLDDRAQATADLPDPARGEAHLLRARALAQLGRGDEAEALLRAALTDPTDPRIEAATCELLVRLLVQGGRAREAEPWCDRLLVLAERVGDADPVSDALLLRGATSRSLGDPEGARRWLEAASARAAGLDRRARALALLADLATDAAATAGGAVTPGPAPSPGPAPGKLPLPSDPETPAARPADAEALAREAIAIAPDHASAAEGWLALGNVHRRRGALESAESAYLRAVDLLRAADRAVGRAELHLACVWLGRGEHERARDAFAAWAEQARGPQAAALRAAWLAAGAADATAEQWADASARVRMSLPRAAAEELDLRWVLEQGADLARAAGHPDRAEWLLALLAG